MSETRCPQCGQIATGQARFCSRCGTTMLGAGASPINPAMPDASRDAFVGLPSMAPVGSDDDDEENAHTRQITASELSDAIGAAGRPDRTTERPMPAGSDPTAGAAQRGPSLNELAGRAAPAPTQIGLPRSEPAMAVINAVAPDLLSRTVRQEPAPNVRVGMKTQVGIASSPALPAISNIVSESSASAPPAAPLSGPSGPLRIPQATAVGIGVHAAASAAPRPAASGRGASNAPPRGHAARTMLGVAMPGIAPLGVSTSDAPPAPNTSAGPYEPTQAAMPSAAPNAPANPGSLPVPIAVPNAHRTMLGVAASHLGSRYPSGAPGTSASGGPPPGSDAAAWYSGGYSGTTTGSTGPDPMAGSPSMPVRFPTAPHVQVVPLPAMPSLAPPIEAAPVRSARRGRSALIAVALALVAVTTGGVITAMLVHRAPPLVAHAELDENGQDVVALQCESCADGTVARLGASSATFAAHAARIATPLVVGANDLAIAIKRPGNGRDEDLHVMLALHYRLRVDQTTLSNAEPALTVVGETDATTTLEVDGKPLVQGSDKKWTQRIALPDSARGTSDAVAPFDRQIPFTVTKAGATAEQGTLAVHTKILPLRIDTPRPRTWVDDEPVLVSGQTSPNAIVHVEDKTVTASARGVWEVEIGALPRETATLHVRADRPQTMPRLAELALERVPNATRVAYTKEFVGASAPSYDQYGKTPDAFAGAHVVIEGKVEDARASGHLLTVLVDVRKGCKTAHCPARLLASDTMGRDLPQGIVKGQTVIFRAVVRKTFTADGTSIPELDVVSIATKARP